MIRKVRRRPSPKRDLLEIATYLEQHSLEVAFRFIDAAERTFQRLAEMPGLGRPRDFDNPALAGLRSKAIEGFPKHLVFYIPRDDEIDICSRAAWSPRFGCPLRVNCESWRRKLKAEEGSRKRY